MHARFPQAQFRQAPSSVGETHAPTPRNTTIFE